VFTLLQMKVPPTTTAKLTARVEKVRASHQSAINKFEASRKSRMNKAAVAKDSKEVKKIASEAERLQQGWNKLTLNNLVRYVLEVGLKNLPEDDVIIKELNDKGIGRGRPRAK
jgi:hypothetical protein